MNNFKTRKIRLRPRRKPISVKTKQNILTAFGIVLVLFMLYWSGVQLIDRLSGARLLGWFSDFLGKDLSADERGRTNILLLGVGGEGHEGKDLTDTVIIASIDQPNGWVSMLSIPRDLYVESTLGGSRINRLYEKGKMKWGVEEGLDFTRATLEKVLQIPLHYGVKADFEAFEKIVDAVDGVDVFVSQDINDPEYPRDGTYEFEPFFLAKGQQHLDGKTALKYARSRHTSSDFDRSRRQHEVLLALKQKAKEENLLGKKRLIKDLYYSLNDHVETNLSVREIVTLADFAAHWNSDQFTNATLNDEPVFHGGFLYTPLRELFGGAYVLLPAGDTYDSLRYFVQLILFGPRNIENFPLVILNGTETSGLAAKARNILNRFGMKFSHLGNARVQNLETTVWYVLTPDAQPLVDFLNQLIPGTIQNTLPEEYRQNPKFINSKIILELGNDAVPAIDKLDIFKNVVLLKPLPTGTPAGTTTPINNE